jgi:pyruvate kinase
VVHSQSHHNTKVLSSTKMIAHTDVLEPAGDLDSSLSPPTTNKNRAPSTIDIQQQTTSLSSTTMLTRLFRKAASLPVSTTSVAYRCLATVTIFDLQHSKIPLTKIVATIGPTSEQAEPLKECVDAGMKLMRLNFSHATPQEVELRCANLASADDTSYVSVLLDTKGPELRTGKLANDISGHDTVDMNTGATVTLHSSPASLPSGGSTATDLLIDFPVLAQVLVPGGKVLLDDGSVVLEVMEITGPNTIRTVVQQPGSVRSRAGVNLPKANTADHLPALSEKDKADIRYGMDKADIDFVAASFVQTAQHVHDIRAHCQAVAIELGAAWKDKPLPKIISKIETATALDHFDEILAASDGIMVARGDLGVEIPLVQVAVAQKEMVRACNAVGKPVIVATQMLETMTKKYAPTRAEVADVTNAVLDGADCVMLSGETAKGIAPANVIATMQSICTAAEHADMRAIHLSTSSSSVSAAPPMVRAVVAAAASPNTAAILLHDATLAPLVAAGHPAIPIFVRCKDKKQARHLQIYRGVIPMVVDDLVQAASQVVGAGESVVYLDGSGRLQIIELIK